MINKTRTIFTHIFFTSIIILLVHTAVYGKNRPNDTNTSVTQNSVKEILEIEANDSNTKLIIGRVEDVRINPGNMIINARIDTGATTTSLGVDEIQIINEDGKEWAEVKIDDTTMKFKVLKYIRIKRHGAKSVRRPVVRLRLTLGDISETVNVTLADRSKFNYRMLIGRNYLYDRFIVDVSLKNTINPQEYKE